MLQPILISRRIFGCSAIAACGLTLAKSLNARPKPALAQLLDDAVNRGLAAGYSAFLIRDGRCQTYVAGVRDLHSQLPMTPNTIFRIASITKPIIAAAVMMLVDEGKIGLESPIDHWIPELANRQVVRSLAGPIDDLVPSTRRITLRDLITMQMGLGLVLAPPGSSPLMERFAELGLAPGPGLFGGSAQDFLDRLSLLPLAFHPGERWLYHTGMDVAGILVSRIARMPLSEFLQERLTGPLEMVDTGFFVPLAKADRLAALYKRGPDERLHPADEAFDVLVPPAMESGGGGLVSTASDLGRFGKMLLDDGRAGGRQILSLRSARLMRTDQITATVKKASPFFPGFWESYGWGFGMAVSTSTDAISKSGRAGWWGGTGTTMFLDPNSGTAAVLLSQSMMIGPNDTAVSNAFLEGAFHLP